ncbi:hypothetical protein [Bacillus wiedmannii]|uniref:Group-specific protein n=1 Tax=Bacillus wiedmannii TaxID=1890302 RepID=A0A242Z619_9BACI|nr:hypothetical protein [Bacillus wiedmannii]MED3123923.1 hypothetical protein [Bacillus wiedmannii]OTX87061.1 hypothetical protein BK730_19410 [Bacillus wiedmannii]
MKYFFIFNDFSRHLLVSPQNPTETNNNEVSLQTLRVIGFIVLISGYILVALSEVGTLKNLLLQPNTTPNLAEVDPF